MGLSVKQIYDTARAAGFTPTAAVTATAIALAESGGNPSARCHNCFPGITEDSRGLWQINVDAHPQYAGQNLSDPLTNARAAFSVSSGGRNFQPWSTYTSGSYRGRLSAVYGGLGITNGGAPPDSAGAGVPAAAGGADSAAAGPTQAGILPSLPNPFGAITNAAGKDVAKIVLTGSFVLGGITLVVLGLYRGVQPAVQRVQQVATTVGKAAAA